MAEQPAPLLENGEKNIENHSPAIKHSSSQTVVQDQYSAHSSSPKNGTESSIPHGTEDNGSSMTEDPVTTLDDYDWTSLEERFCAKMEECGRAEQKLYDEFGNCVRVRGHALHTKSLTLTSWSSSRHGLL